MCCDTKSVRHLSLLGSFFPGARAPIGLETPRGQSITLHREPIQDFIIMGDPISFLGRAGAVAGLANVGCCIAGQLDRFFRSVNEGPEHPKTKQRARQYLERIPDHSKLYGALQNLFYSCGR